MARSRSQREIGGLVACKLDPDACRRKHVATRLHGATQDGTDFEAYCPVCGHGGFRISKPTRSRTLRNIWTCACKRCKCGAGQMRAEMLGRGIPRDCLGLYDGPVQKVIAPDVARRLDLAVRDILAIPQRSITPTDVRLILAEACGQEAPEDFTLFVKFAMSYGIGSTQAKEAAARWGCRPSGSRPPQTGGAVADASRTTIPSAAVKPLRSEPRDWSETDQLTVGNRPSGITDTGRSDDTLTQNVRRSETGQQANGDEMDAALTVLDEAGLTVRPREPAA